jgi:hypothetical protein
MIYKKILKISHDYDTGAQATYCLQITSLAEMFCPDHPTILGPPDHFGNVNMILQDCSDVEIDIPRGTTVETLQST